MAETRHREGGLAATWFHDHAGGTRLGGQHRPGARQTAGQRLFAQLRGETGSSRRRLQVQGLRARPAEALRARPAVAGGRGGGAWNGPGRMVGPASSAAPASGEAESVVSRVINRWTSAVASRSCLVARQYPQVQRSGRAIGRRSREVSVDDRTTARAAADRRRPCRPRRSNAGMRRCRRRRRPTR